MKPARERYPNLAALGQGLLSGYVSEWPALKPEAARLLDELDRLDHRLDEAEARRPWDYLERASVAVVIVLLIAWTLSVLRLGGGMSQ